MIDWLPLRSGDSWEWHHPEGIQLLVQSPQNSSRGLMAWSEISWTGTVPAPGIVHASRIDVMGARTVDTLVSKIKAANIGVKADWRHLIQQALYDVIQDHLKGPAPIDLTTVEPSPATFILRPLIGAVGATSIVAAGGTGKSLLALAASCCIGTGSEEWFPMKPLRSGPVFYIDWEADADTHAHRLKALEAAAGEKFPSDTLHYIEAREPLRLWAKALAYRVAAAGAVLVVIDSVMLARGGEAAVLETNDFYAALRSLGVPSLLIDHQSRDALEKGKSTAFGTIVNENSARLRWAAKGDKDHLVLRSPKQNNFGKLPTISLSLETQSRNDLLTYAKWRQTEGRPSDTTITERILDTVNDHPAGLTVAAISQTSGLPVDSFRRTLYRLAEKGLVEQTTDTTGLTIWLPLADPL